MNPAKYLNVDGQRNFGTQGGDRFGIGSGKQGAVVGEDVPTMEFSRNTNIPVQYRKPSNIIIVANLTILLMQSIQLLILVIL